MIIKVFKMQTIYFAHVVDNFNIAFQTQKFLQQLLWKGVLFIREKKIIQVMQSWKMLYKDVYFELSSLTNNFAIDFT